MANFVTDLLNTITGDQNKQAQDQLAWTMQQINGIHTPSAKELQLDPLAEYGVASTLTPAEMQAAEAGPSAFNSENLSSVPVELMQQVLAKEKSIADANGMTPQEQAAIAEAESGMNRSVAGQRGAIAQDFAGRGIPQSLIAAALENGTVGQNAQQAYESALNARAGAANEGLTALSNEGNLASTLYGQEAGQANTVAAAQNALNEFNAQNSQQAKLANQSNEQTANVYNTQTAQDVSNKNTLGKQTVQIQNQVQAPQEAAELALKKGQELSGVGADQASQSTLAGQEAAGIFSGLLGAGSQFNSAVVKAAEGGEIPRQNVPATNFKAGGPVPGQAQVAGDSPANDTVPARLSPGEFVVPRTAMARPAVRDFLAQNVPTPRPPTPAPHPADVASILKALAVLRGTPEAA